MICEFPQSQLHLVLQILPGVDDTTLDVQVDREVLEYPHCLSDQLRRQLLASLDLPD